MKDKEKKNTESAHNPPFLVRFFWRSVFLINEITKPPLRLYDNIKDKIEERKKPKFEDPQLNEWYPYYKENGTYPDFLVQRYPNLRDIYDQKVPEKAPSTNTPSVASISVFKTTNNTNNNLHSSRSEEKVTETEIYRKQV